MFSETTFPCSCSAPVDRTRTASLPALSDWVQSRFRMSSSNTEQRQTTHMDSQPCILKTRWTFLNLQQPFSGRKKGKRWIRKESPSPAFSSLVVIPINPHTHQFMNGNVHPQHPANIFFCVCVILSCLTYFWSDKNTVPNILLYTRAVSDTRMMMVLRWKLQQQWKDIRVNVVITICQNYNPGTSQQKHQMLR